MSSPEIIIIVAMTTNRVIGKDNMIPWHIPEDLQHFKKTTTGHAIIMGRRTWESIGRPLPERTNIVVSRKKSLAIQGCQTAESLDQALQIAAPHHQKIFIIGGGEIYREALPLAHFIQITLLHRNIDGTVYFPTIPHDQFVLHHEEQQHWSEPVTLQYFTRNPSTNS